MRTKLADGNLSVAEMVLIATAVAANWTTNPVPYGELVVQAWRMFPVQFSLPNHPEFPDSSDVHKRLYTTLKSGELIESLGNKTFRVTELGLTKARSIVALMPEKPSARSMIEVDVYVDAATQKTIEAILDADDRSMSSVADGLLAAILEIRFPRVADAQGSEALNHGHRLVVGDTEFIVMVPATLESLAAWFNSGSRGGRRWLLVRDAVVSAVRCILEKDAGLSTAWVVGFESFVAQVIDGMAMFEERRTVEVLESLAKQYNLKRTELLPCIHLRVVEREL